MDKAGARKIVVSVKGGENVGLSMVKDLITTVMHNQAEIGLFITLAEPTQPTIAEAAKAGFYTSATGKKFPRLATRRILFIRFEPALHAKLDGPMIAARAIHTFESHENIPNSPNIPRHHPLRICHRCRLWKKSPKTQAHAGA